MRRSVLVELSAELEQASATVAAVYETLSDDEITDAGQEIDRRRLERTTRALGSIVGDLLGRLRQLKLRISADACPHCGWLPRYEQVALCPRCHSPRAPPRRLGVPREPHPADPRDPGGAGPPRARAPRRR